jgi:hypothetical protein
MQMNAKFHALRLYKNFFLRPGPVLLLPFAEGPIGPANARATDCLDNHGNLRLFAAALGPGHVIAALTAYIFSAPHVSMSE